MIKYTAFLLIVAIRIFYHPASDKSAIEPFSKPAPATQVSTTPAKPGKQENTVDHDKVVSRWILIPNESEEKLCFSSEMVFGIEKPQTGYSLFIDQTVIQKMFYRIGMLNKSRASTC
jgi:hypothetical protein